MSRKHLQSRTAQQAPLSVATATSKVSESSGQKGRIDFSWVAVFSFAISVMAGVAFAAGKAYRQHYLQGFSLSDSQLPWTFQDVVYLGITKQLPILLAAPIAAILGVFVFVLVVALSSALARLVRRKRRQSRSAQTQASADNTNTQEPGTDVLEFLTRSLGAVLMVMFLSVIYVAKSEQLGASDAKAELTALKQGDEKRINLTPVRVERVVSGQRIAHHGYLVSCSERACGLVEKIEGRILSRVIPLDNVLSFAADVSLKE